MLRQVTGFLLTLTLTACSDFPTELRHQGSPSHKQGTVSCSDRSLCETAEAVLTALENLDGFALSALVHPEKGVRFSPYPEIKEEFDQVIAAPELRTLWTDPQIVRDWGPVDDFPVRVMRTPLQYHDEFIINCDFRKLGDGPRETYKARYNVTSNFPASYPDAKAVQYYVSDCREGSAEQSDFFAALTLAFERCEARWCLVGIIHDGLEPAEQESGSIPTIPAY